LQEIQTFTGGRLAGITAKLTVRPEEDTYFDRKEKRKRTSSFWALSLEVEGDDMQKLIANLTENARLFAESRKLLGSNGKVAFGNFFWPISGGLIWPTLGRCRLGEAFALPSRKNKDRRRSCGNVGIPPLRRDFQGRWEGWETVFGFSTLSTARHFHS
jgi:hypothetical protein